MRNGWTPYLILFLMAAVTAAEPQHAQAQAAFNSPEISELGILNNSVANLQAANGRIWVGPFLNYSDDDGASWYVVASDSLFGTINRLFSIDVEGDVVLAGLGRADASGGESVQTATGFLISTDGGETFNFRFPQLDAPDDDTEQYGVSTLPALPVIVPQQSPPFDVDYDAASGTMYVAGWASGLRRSVDMGRSWTRVVLPPDDLDAIDPDTPYSFPVEPRRGSNGSLNHMGFSVLVTSDGTVWAGTAGGLNRSLDGGVSWQKFKADGTAASLTGDWIISIEEQVWAGGSVIWAASWNTGESGGGTGQFGVTLTRDGGATFEQTLQGERVYDFAFDGSTAYVAGDGGLFISRDFGRSWDSINQFRDQANPNRFVKSDASVFSVEVDGSSLWVGTSDGLLRSDDGGSSWTIFRLNVPLASDGSNPRIPTVETFAYPNPFSPGADQFIRIKYEMGTSGSATIRIFDNGMNLVRELNASAAAGEFESIWDGRDDRGMQVSNGPYFYDVSTGGNRFRGKILVVE